MAHPCARSRKSHRAPGDGALGLPIGVILSTGEAHDVTGYDDLMAERDSNSGAMLADKGYDSDPVRQDLRDRDTTPEIPTKRSRKVQYSVDKRLYAPRARIEKHPFIVRHQATNQS
jgi:IS5 family transposase